MQRHRRKPNFPHIHPYDPQPRHAAEKGVHLLTHGLLRMRFDNPERIVSSTRYRARRMLEHIKDKYMDKLGGGRAEKDTASIAGAVYNKEEYLARLRDEFFGQTLDYWINILSRDAALKFLIMWEDDIVNQKRVLGLAEEKEMLSWLAITGSNLREKYDVTHLRIAYRCLRNGDTAMGKRYIREFGYALGTINPFLVYEEIKKDMHPEIVWKIREANERLKHEKFSDAVIWLKSAAEMHRFGA